MGKLEKLIVLSVLAVIAVILVVSLTLDDPLKKDKVVMAGSSSAQPPGLEAARKSTAPDDKVKSAAPAASPIVNGGANPAANPVAPQVQPTVQAADSAKLAAANPPAAAAPSPLLSTNVAPAKPEGAPVATPSGIPAGSILKASDGLQESYLSDMRFYTWQSGDSFRSIAGKYYGDPNKFTILRRSNEGRDVVQPGEKILVPVFDMDAPHPSDAMAASAKPATQTKDPSAAKSTAAKAPEASNAAGGPRVHVVLDGESLWKIAKLELGDGGRWNEIYEANRDVLSKPEAVHAGLKLRIPAK